MINERDLHDRRRKIAARREGCNGRHGRPPRAPRMRLTTSPRHRVPR
jgi:hypothetical protein